MKIDYAACTRVVRDWAAKMLNILDKPGAEPVGPDAPTTLPVPADDHIKVVDPKDFDEGEG